MSKAGYGPGKGRTFTPSIQAKWTESFNEFLERSPGISRNSLTEKLIEEGMKARSGSGLSLPLENLTSAQIEMLSSEEGKQMLLNVSLLLLGNPQGLSNFQAINPVKVSSPEVIRVTNSETIIENSNNKNENEHIIEKLDPKQKLLAKMAKLNKSKNNL